MPAIVQLIVGPPGADLTGRLVEAYRKVTRAGLGTALFLVPTRRDADQVRGRLLAPGTAAVVAPHILTIQTFADELVRTNDPTLRPLSDLDRKLLLDSVLADLREAGELPYFAAVVETRGFADAAAGYVQELKEAGADLRQLLKAAGGRQGGELNRHAQATRIFERYHRRLAKLHRLDPGDRLGRAAGLWAAGERGPFTAVRSVFVGGFSSFTSPQRMVLDALRDSAEHIWIGLIDGDADTFAGPRSVRDWVTGPVGERTLFDSAPEVTTETVEVSHAKPGGVRHLANTLFRQLSSSEADGSSNPPDPTGLHLIEAPGDVGEARLVARQIRSLLACATHPNRILVTARHLRPAAVELLREVFDEYAIPHAVAGADPLARIPAVAFLLRAWRLADEGWPFAPVAAVLRSGYFRPNWPEVQTDPEVPAKAETLLRMLGETRGREAYLAAARSWEQTPPNPLEDEQAEEPRRKRIHLLAQRCLPFLERFFQAWDRFKPSGSAEALAGWLRGLADDIGMSSASAIDPTDTAGLARFWRELDRWAKAEGSRKPVRADRFARILGAVTATPCRVRSPRDPGRVRILPAGDAAGLDCDYLFLTGLSEGSWPDLSGPESLLDDTERERLRKTGFGLPEPAARLAAEELLFLELVAAPQRGLFLSYPALDEQGQKLLPSSFLRAVGEAFPAGVIPTTRQRMRIEGYFSQEPLSPAEVRSQFARRVFSDPQQPPPGQLVRENLPVGLGATGGLSAREGVTRAGKPPVAPQDRGRSFPGVCPEPSAGLGGDLVASLHRSRVVADARFRRQTFGAFDGELRDPAVTAELARRFGPDRALSPTALETYIACPFRFWLEHVLRLDVLKDPTEEVEHTRRGAAFHRALARFHRWVKETVPQTLDGPALPAGMTDDLIRRVGDAAEEYALRAPSVASRELWRLEGERLKRAAARYRDHWEEFRKPWQEKGATPTPFAFEADFGVPGQNVHEALTIRVGEIEVRLGGRIDRVDVTDVGGGSLGFWVIDYKTGRATNYSAAEVERFEKLQLPLYALAVERVLLKDRPARPLGLAYWLVTDTGPKPMLPAGKRSLFNWLTDPARWVTFRGQLEAWVTTLAGHIRAGDFPLAPRSDHCTDTCPFGPVCRISQSRATGKVFPLALPSLRVPPSG
jgi:ATP-dependent helicase/nuclease subunit B